MGRILNLAYRHEPKYRTYNLSWDNPFVKKIPAQDQQKKFNQVASDIGTMKSARNKQINRYYEFIYEVFAQYLMSKNKVQFKSKLSPILVNKMNWGKPEGRYLNQQAIPEIEEEIKSLSDYCNDTIEQILGECVNKIFLM